MNIGESCFDNELCSKIGPSILNSNLANLTNECVKLLEDGADYLHLDVMDGHFVPNLTFGHNVIKCLRQDLNMLNYLKAFLEVHMMVENPEKWIELMKNAGANMYTFHAESTNNIQTCIRKIRENEMKVGLAINPNTSVDTIMPYIEYVDMVLIMTVEPGFGGQSFMYDMLTKVELLRKKFSNLDIEVDGGIGLENIKEVGKAGANMIVSGSFLINSPNRKQTIRFFRDTIKSFLNKNKTIL